MLYTGIDLTEIDRIRNSIRNPRFITRVFSVDEQNYCAKLKDPAPSFAAFFAAKEAFSKALGTGIRGFDLREVSVRHDELGAPHLSLSGSALKLAEKRGLSFSLSLTHSRSDAAAVVVAWDSKSV